MVTHCADPGFYVSDYPTNIFVEDFGVLMLYIVPAAICVVLWKVFVTNRTAPRGNVLQLGLNETSATPAELYGRKFPWRALFLHAAVGVATFEFGVFVYETYCSIQQWFSTLNGN
jgi:uncharacterized membrane protein YagU involved in acid resistance